MDSFKRYLRERREEMDVDRPGDQLWPKIQGRIEPKKSITLSWKSRRWLVAASVVLLAGIGIAAFLWSDRRKQSLMGQADSANVIAPSPSSTKSLPDAPPGKQAFIAPASGPVTRKTYISGSQGRKGDGQSLKKKRLSPLESLEHNYLSVINKQMPLTQGLPILIKNVSFGNDVKKRLLDMDLELREIRMAISKDGLNRNLVQCLINVYQLKIEFLKQLQVENTRMETHKI